jgi:6-phospho-3-hexuloisomerase
MEIYWSYKKGILKVRFKYNKIIYFLSEMKIKLITKEVEKELKRVLEKISEKDTSKFTNLILKSKNIFLTGQGRSGLVIEAFAMRLMQLGLKSHIVGQPTTPAIKKNDLLVAISGSGKTKITEDIIKQAKKSKAKICLITANKKSLMAKKSDLIIEIKAKTKLCKKKSIEPLGSLFEQASFLYLDSVIILLMKKLGKKEKFLKKRHSKVQ